MGDSYFFLIYRKNVTMFLFVYLMVFNATFNNISVISFQSVLVEETGGPGKNPPNCRKSLTNKVLPCIKNKQKYTDLRLPLIPLFKLTYQQLLKQNYFLLSVKYIEINKTSRKT
jgi:hypothetical protein